MSTDKPPSAGASDAGGDGQGDVLPTGTHYRRARPVYDELAELAAPPDPGGDGHTPTPTERRGRAVALGNADFVKWYHTDEFTRVEDLETGWQGTARGRVLDADYDELRRDLDRVLYATINYQPERAVHEGERRFRRTGDGKTWAGDGDTPLPGYGDLAAIAPFADIDLAADVKHQRPEGDIPRASVEAAIRRYVDGFADLVGDRDAVFVLDSVGGVYVMAAPTVTRPIARAYDGADRARLFTELTDRLNDWLATLRNDVNATVPAVEGVFEPDLLNNKNRLYKAPLSVHSRLDGVVTPMDPADPEYEFMPLATVSDAAVAAARRWAASFTDAYDDRVSALVATLWADEYDAAGPGPDRDSDETPRWRRALDAWLAAERDREAAREREEQAREARRRERREAGVTLDDLETTDDAHDLFDAIAALDVREVAEAVCRAYPGGEWDTDSGRDPPRFDPPWRASDSGTSCFADRNGFTDLKEGKTGGDAVTLVARAAGIITDCGETPDGQAFFEAVDALRDLGFTLPEYDSGEGDEHAHAQAPFDGDSGGGGDADYPRTIETSPPRRDPRPFDREAERERLRGPVLDRCLAHDGPALVRGEAGIGKTTTTSKELSARGERTAHLFHTHAKAHEHVATAETPEYDLHLRGADQPIHDDCMAARADAHGTDADPECPEHDHPAECPTMHPVYNLAADHQLKRRFRKLEQWVGTRVASFRLREEIEAEFGGDLTDYPWFQQFDDLKSADRIVGVAEYAHLKTVRDRFTVVLDDTGEGFAATTHELDAETVLSTANNLETFAERQGTDEAGRRRAHNAAAVARFARDLADCLASDDPDATLAGLDPPRIKCQTYREWEGTNFQRRREQDLPDETLAQLRVRFAEYVVRRVQDGEGVTAPPDLKPLYAAAIEAGAERTIDTAPGPGFDAEAARTAIAVPLLLDECPRCNTATEPHEGRRVCPECGWDETADYLTTQDGTPARAAARLVRGRGNTPVALEYRELPAPTDLPTDPIVLAANADTEPYAGLFGVPVDAVHVEDPAPDGFEIPHTHVVQATTGMYHKSTLEQSTTARDRYQRTIDRAGRVHQAPLFVGRKAVLGMFEFPDNATTVHYHGLRGLNYTECDAVFALGGPHPHVDALRFEAEVLAMDHPDLNAGGVEYSTLDHAERPPAYRKLNYEADDGTGRAVRDKAFSGLTGTLFREKRAGELEQAVHRIRPLLADADAPTDVYLLTSVATDLPVDQLTTLEALASDLGAVLPVPERALELLDALADVANGDAPDGFRAGTLLDRDEHGRVTFNKRAATRLARLAGLQNPQGDPLSYRTVCGYVNDLADLGIAIDGEYERREGVRFSTDGTTLKQALQVCSYNGGFKVAAVRRFRRLAADADGTLAWLRWAREAFGLTGDREAWCGVDPPPA